MVTNGQQVLQVLPQVPPAVCGVGDYSWNLARRLQSEHCIYSSFLVAKPSEHALSGAVEFPVFDLPALRPRALVDFVASRKKDFSAVILQMSAYGYQKRGVPLWLALGWRNLSRMKDRPRLITMFHELAASGPVTSSAFWLNFLQKWVASQLARSSDGLRTNRKQYAEWLGGICGIEKEKIVNLPVYSNFGEPEVLPLLHQRDSAMVMFGWGISSGESLPEVLEKAAGYCRQFGLTKLHLIGGGSLPEMVLHGVELRRYGFMMSDEISKLLLSSRMAYTAYNPDFFGKSGLMAAFASHGLAVICQGKTSRLPDGLEHGVNVLNEAMLGKNVDASALPLDALAAALRGWYDQHSLRKNAASYASQLRALQTAS